ncbi:MAG: hypothetical protein KGZ51_03515 [Erysipelothrix sp.]|nr:hypothetical protein [Erysipelothrix sp.]
MATKYPTTIPRAAVALDAVRPDLNRAARQMLLGQAKSESDFGNHFSTPDGSNSNNWGAIYANGDHDPPTIPVGDTFEGKPITMKGAWNISPESGAKQFSNLVINNYKVLPFAESGDAWGYARSLWRDGPGTSKPSYYTGFPPGHKYSLAPEGTVQFSPQDYYYRILAYAKFLQGGANAVAKALGEQPMVFVKPPPPPKEGESLPVADSNAYSKDTGSKSKPIESGTKDTPTPSGGSSVIEDLGGDDRPTTTASKISDAVKNVAKKPGVIAVTIGIVGGILYWIFVD